jgi:hypothetical protein
MVPNIEIFEETFQFVNQDLPEAYEFLKKDLASLFD